MLDQKQETVHVSKVVDLDSLNITVPTPIEGPLDREEYEGIDWKVFTIEEQEFGEGAEVPQWPMNFSVECLTPIGT